MISFLWVFVFFFARALTFAPSPVCVTIGFACNVFSLNCFILRTNVGLNSEFAEIESECLVPEFRERSKL